MRLLGITIGALMTAALAPATPATATFPGHNGRVAFYSDQDGAGFDIWTAELDGSDPINLTDTPEVDEVAPAWDPTGTMLVFQRMDADGAADVMVMPGDGSAPPMNLTSSPGVDDGFPQFCDEDAIVYHSNSSGNYDVYELLADGSGIPVKLTTSSANDLLPTCAPDGTAIAWRNDAGGSEIWQMNRDGSEKENLTGHPSADSDPDYAPDGQKLAFTSTRDGNAEVFLMNLATLDVEQLTDTSGVTLETPHFFPDGTEILFTEFTPGGRKRASRAQDVREMLRLDILTGEVLALVLLGGGGVLAPLATLVIARALTLGLSPLAKLVLAVGILNRVLPSGPDVRARAEPDDCLEGIKVIVQRKVGKRWKKAATAMTNDNGRYRAKIADVPGRYRAKVSRQEIEHLVCRPDRSPTVRYR